MNRTPDFMSGSTLSLSDMPIAIPSNLAADPGREVAEGFIGDLALRGGGSSKFSTVWVAIGSGTTVRVSSGTRHRSLEARVWAGNEALAFRFCAGGA
jgi:hypothetical protein